jgi:predicted aldo/keto reductase-like oxidoreductase
MEYVDFGKTGLKVSRYGLGCMRFPAAEAEAIAMVHHAIDSGVNYLDTAYVYGNSEVIVGKALQDGYRTKVNLATKSPLWNITTYADFEKYLDEELLRLQTDYIDIYMLHNLGPDNWEKVQRLDGFTFLDKMVTKGKILHQGFSIHNTEEAFREIVDTYPWEMALIQMNILGEHQQVGLEGLKYGAAKGLAMVIMEPLRGGSLLTNAPATIAGLLEAHSEQRSLAEWCFRWLYDKQEVAVILSGASTMAQLHDNLRIFADTKAGVMTPDDQALIRKVQLAFEAVQDIACSGCNYCLPCPEGIAIPEIFSLYNDYRRLGEPPLNRIFYQRNLEAAGTGGGHCLSCGTCESQCPQGLSIPALLQVAHTELMKPMMPPR